MRLDAASARWLRHTAGTALANSIEIHHVRDALGHDNIATTNTYVRSGANERHAAISRVHKITW